jgi:hypothetical protein
MPECQNNVKQLGIALHAQESFDFVATEEEQTTEAASRTGCRNNLKQLGLAGEGEEGLELCSGSPENTGTDERHDDWIIIFSSTEVDQTVDWMMA